MEFEVIYCQMDGAKLSLEWFAAFFFSSSADFGKMLMTCVSLVAFVAR